MTKFTVVVAALPQLGEALTQSGQFAAVHGISSTSGLRDLLSSPAFGTGAADKVFLFSDATAVDTEQNLEFLISQLGRMGAQVIVVATTPSGRDMVGRVQSAGLLVPPLRVNTALGALGSLGVPVTPVDESVNYVLDLASNAGPLGAPEPASANPFGGPSNPFGQTPAAAPAAPAQQPAAVNPFEAAQPANPFEQAAPAQPEPAAANPFGGAAQPAAQPAAANPFGGPAQPAAQPAAPNPFEVAQPAAQHNPFEQAAPAAPTNNPFEKAAPAQPAPAANPFEQAAPAQSAPNPFEQPNPYGQPAAPTQTNPFENGFGAPAQPAAHSPFSQPSLDTPPAGLMQPGGAPMQVRTIGDATSGQAGAGYGARQRRGYVITVTAPKGGTGKSSLTINLAAYLALRVREAGKNVCIIDANVQQADTGKYIDAFHPNIEDVMRDSSSIHPDRIGNYLVHRPEANLSALLGPSSPEAANPLYYTGAKYAQILEALRPNFDYIFIDTPVAELYHDIFRAFALPQANYVIVAVAPNHTTVLNADTWLNQVCAPQQAGGMGLDKNKVGYVLNRAEDGIAYDEAEVVANLSNWNYLGSVPETKEWKRANNEGQIVAHKNFHELNASFNNVLVGATGDELLQTTSLALPETKSGLMGKLTGLLKKGR
jgi:MinD-like ATPase involved in chromosome partitioning or flagellar assembly